LDHDEPVVGHRRNTRIDDIEVAAAEDVGRTPPLFELLIEIAAFPCDQPSARLEQRKRELHELTEPANCPGEDGGPLLAMRRLCSE
jgi:hypothetical protein